MRKRVYVSSWCKGSEVQEHGTGQGLQLLTPGRKWTDKQHLQEKSVGSLALQNSCLLYKQAHSL